jgi:hypothetical protein
MLGEQKPKNFKDMDIRELVGDKRALSLIVRTKGSLGKLLSDDALLTSEAEKLQEWIADKGEMKYYDSHRDEEFYVTLDGSIASVSHVGGEKKQIIGPVAKDQAGLIGNVARLEYKQDLEK